jgi:hypothetical protein
VQRSSCLAQDFKKRSTVGGWPAALRFGQYFYNPHIRANRQREHIAALDRLTEFLDLVPVDAHGTFFNQLCSRCSVLHEAGIDQPFVDALRQVRFLPSWTSAHLVLQKASWDRRGVRAAPDDLAWVLVLVFEIFCALCVQVVPTSPVVLVYAVAFCARGETVPGLSATRL